MSDRPGLNRHGPSVNAERVRKEIRNSGFLVLHTVLLVSYCLFAHRCFLASTTTGMDNFIVMKPSSRSGLNG